MGLLLELVAWFVGAFTTVYVAVATVSIFIGFVQFLIAAPGAIRSDLERWRLAHAEPPRQIRYVWNEEDAGSAERALPAAGEAGELPGPTSF